MEQEIVEEIFYKWGKLKTDLSARGVTIRKGDSAVVSVNVWSDKSILIHVNSGRKNICLPYQLGYNTWN